MGIVVVAPFAANAAGPPETIRVDAAVADAYLGDRFRQVVPG